MRFSESKCGDVKRFLFFFLNTQNKNNFGLKFLHNYSYSHILIPSSKKKQLEEAFAQQGTRGQRFERKAGTE